MTAYSHAEELAKILAKHRAEMNPQKMIVKLTYTRPSGRTIHEVELPLTQLLLCAMKPAGIFVQSTQGNLEYHSQVLEEVREKVKEGKPYTENHTFEDTVDLLIDLAKQVSLTETVLKHFIEEQPIPHFFWDNLKTLEIVEVV